MNDARARYVADSVATAGPARLLTMLYDRLLVDLARGEKALADGDRAGAAPFVGHAEEVVSELVATLDEDAFTSTIWPILNANCAGCHMAQGSTNTTTTATSFTDNRFVLTGSPDGDLGVTLTMISDTCHPAVDYLLAKPSTVPHPDGNTTQTTAILPAGSANYDTIANWIAGGGCTSP